ncbi:MAG: hypothetical protein JW971_00315 [Synergistales bacterium]|nr:hypothetical protein [Synergistales bacterium]
MERKIRKVQKWLERCLISCRSGSWERAIGDMECANAELRIAREELWLAAENSRQSCASRGLRHLGSAAITLVVASVILMVSAAPIAVNHGVISQTVSSEKKPVLEWLEKDEEMLISALRKSLSENGFRETDLSDTGIARNNWQPEMEKTVAQGGNIPSFHGQEILQTAGISRELRESPYSRGPSEIMMEEVLALLEIGQRVLRNPEPPIKVTQ